MSDIDLTAVPRSTRDHFCLYREPRETRIKSGQLLEMRTDNPEKRPLPSMALVEMQWHLQRIMDVAGAADMGDIDDCYFLDDEMRNPGSEKVGDDSLSSNFSNLSEPVIPELELPAIVKQVSQHIEDEIKGR